MSRLLMVFVVVLLLVPPAYGWERNKDTYMPGKPTEPQAGRCDVAGYVPYMGPGSPIPDGDPAGVVLGPIKISACFEVVDLAVEITMDHTWIGDLIIYLIYDEECDGPDAGDPYVSLLCRPNLDGCPPDDCCGCSDNVAGSYLFSDSAPESLGDPCNYLPDIPPGCFAPAPESALALADLADYQTGCWYLWAADNMGIDEGTIWGWTLYVLPGGASATENVSWSGVKVMYTA